MENQKPRSVARIVEAVRTLEGEGFIVRRAFPSGELDHFDPFLLLDEMGPMQVAPGEAKGAPDHPHRGFETVTYMLEGEMRHRDSQGNAGRIGPGDVQWMTAGAGVIHSEMPGPELLEKGGRMHGFQLWVNLPSRDKMMRPRYQEVPAAGIPAAQSADGSVSVRVIAGEAMGRRAAIDTRTPIFYLHYRLLPGATVQQLVAPEFAVFAHVFEGEGLFGSEARPAGDGHVVFFAPGGDHVTIANHGADGIALELLLIGGAPLREPVARYGPFVMNTRTEIMQAIEDYNTGKMGSIPASR